MSEKSQEFESMARHELQIIVRGLSEELEGVKQGYRRKGLNKTTLLKHAYMARGKKLGFVQIGLLKYDDPDVIAVNVTVRKVLEYLGKK